MTDTTITSANSVVTMTQASLFPAPVQFYGYSADKAFSQDAVDFAETQMGVDGRMTAGYTPNVTPFTITLQADSPTRQYMTILISAMRQAREIFYVNMTVTIPSTGEVVFLTRGVLKNAKSIPDANKVLQPIDYQFEFESVDGSLT